MKKILRSFAIAFSMYSKIPMPQIQWTDESMQYAFCFFPFIGLVIGGLEYLWHAICVFLNFGNLLFSVGVILIPFLVTGGIHFDGFMDTSDAMSSWREREDRLRILKDSHIGAFAVICAACYLLAAVGFSSALSERAILVLLPIFGIARALSGIAVLTFPNANPKGTAAAFGQRAARKRVLTVLIVILVVLCAAELVLHTVLGLIVILTFALMFFYYHRFCMKYFGGLTGDLAGYFVSTAELAALIVVVFADRILLILTA